MKQLLVLSLFAVVAVGCGAEQASEPTSGVTATDTVSDAVKWKRNSKKRNPKWVIAIDGLPELSGRTIVVVGSIEGGMFTLASSELTASISLTPEGETSNLMMTFKEQKVRCMNYGAVVSNVDGTRVELSGEVECSPTGGGGSEPRKAQIDGWFETKK